MRITGRKEEEERAEEPRTAAYGNMLGRWEFDGRMSHYVAPDPLVPSRDYRGQMRLMKMAAAHSTS